MDDIELRERFGQWAEPLRATAPPAITVIRGRARRRTARLAATAGAALVATAAAASLVIGGLPGTPPPARPALWGSARYPAPPGQPYVLVNESARGPAELRNMATGKVIRIVRPLGSRAVFTALAASTNDRLFVLAQQDGAGRLTLDEIGIGAPGGTARLRRLLPRLSLFGAQVYGMTVNATGTRLVFNTIPPGGAGPATLRVYNLASGDLVGRWTSTDTVSLDYWSGPDQLAIDWQAGTPMRSGLRILDTDRVFAPASSLAADTRPDPALRGFDRGALTADGSVAISLRPFGSAMQVQEFSAVSGRLVRAFPIGSASALQHSPNFCGVLWASANGRDLLTQCGSRQQAVVDGQVTPTRLAWALLAQQDGAIGTFAW